MHLLITPVPPAFSQTYILRAPPWYECSLALSSAGGKQLREGLFLGGASPSLSRAASGRGKAGTGWVGLLPACREQGVRQRRGCVPVGLHLRNFSVAQTGNIVRFTAYKHHSHWFPLKINTEEGSAVGERYHSEKSSLVFLHRLLLW